MNSQPPVKWDTRIYKTQAQINKEIKEIECAYSPKKVREYEENGVVITVYEAR